jgi:hypothetical protein
MRLKDVGIKVAPRSSVRSRAGFCLAAALALGACSESPPGCGDAQVSQRLRDSLVQEAYEDAKKGYSEAGKASLELSNVRSDGYNEGAKKHMCRGDLTLARSQKAGGPTTTEVTYSVQGIEGKQGEFAVRIAGFQDADFILKLNAASQLASIRSDVAGK